MVRPSGDDRDAIDRAFADLIADYERTADESDGYRPLPPEPPVADHPTPGSVPLLDTSWVDRHSLFRFEEPEPVEEPEFVEDDRFVPEPMEPIHRPDPPVLIAWIGLAYAVLAVLVSIFGVRLPAWAGWLAVVSFVGALAIMVTRLPRNRPPDSGDGAVL